MAGFFLRALWRRWARESALQKKNITLTREGAAFLAKLDQRLRRLEVQRAGERARARGIAQQQLRSLRFRVRQLSLNLRALSEARARGSAANDEQTRQLADEQTPSAHRDRRIQELEAELAVAVSAAEGKDREIEHLRWTLNDCRQESRAALSRSEAEAERLQADVVRLELWKRAYEGNLGNQLAGWSPNWSPNK